MFFRCTVLQNITVMKPISDDWQMTDILLFCFSHTHSSPRPELPEIKSVCLLLNRYRPLSIHPSFHPSIHPSFHPSIQLFYFSDNWSTCQPIYEVHSVRVSLTLLSVFLRIKSICLRREHTLSLSLPTRFHILMLLFGTTVIPNWGLLEKI